MKEIGLESFITSLKISGKFIESSPRYSATKIGGNEKKKERKKQRERRRQKSQSLKGFPM